MAIQYFGLNRGQQLKDVATGTSSTGRNVELAVNDGAGITRGELEILVETLQQFVYNQRTTPFAQ
jgi:hypothetical protein